MYMLPTVIAMLIAEYDGRAIAPWIPTYRLKWTSMTTNSSDGALDLLESKPWLINARRAYSNTNSRIVPHLRGDSINTRALSENPAPHALRMLRECPDLLHWDGISANTNSNMLQYAFSIAPSNMKMSFLLSNRGAIPYIWHILPTTEVHNLCMNESKTAMDIIKKIHNDPNDPRYEQIEWVYLSANNSDGALDLLESYPQKIDWSAFSSNSNTRAVQMLRQNPNDIIAEFLCSNENPDAMRLLGELYTNDRSILLDWDAISANPATFSYPDQKIVQILLEV